MALAMIENAEKTGRWETAQDVHDTPSAKGSVPIQKAIRVFLDHCVSKSGKNLPGATVSAYRTALERLEEFCDDCGCPRMSEIDESVLMAFQDSWTEWPISSRPTATYISLLKAFGDFCLERGWWSGNYALRIKKPTNDKHTVY
jgi:site-specific recombinase XerD